jgi:hypothetical protein
MNSGSDGGSGTLTANLTGTFYIATPTGTADYTNSRYCPQLNTSGCLIQNVVTNGYRVETGQGSASFCDIFNSSSGGVTVEIVYRFKSSTVPTNTSFQFCGFKSVTAPGYGWEISSKNANSIAYCWDFTWKSGSTTHYLSPAWGNTYIDNREVLTGSAAMPTNGWHHVILVYSGSLITGSTIGNFGLLRDGLQYNIDRANSSQNPPLSGSTLPNIENAVFYTGLYYTPSAGGAYGSANYVEYHTALVAVYDRPFVDGEALDHYREFMSFLNSTYSASLDISGTMPITVQLPARNNITESSASAGGVDARASKLNVGIN